MKLTAVFNLTLIFLNVFVYAQNDLKLQWENSFDENVKEQANCLIEADNGDLVTVGHQMNWDDTNLCVWRTDAKGNKLWHKNFPDKGKSKASSIIQTFDKGFAIVGYTKKDDWNYDMWLIKIDTNGTIEWYKNFGNKNADMGHDIIETYGGGFALVGRTYSVTENSESPDLWFIKTNNMGEKLWEKYYGGNKWDEARSLIQTNDRGYVVLGSTESKGSGKSDVWLLKLNYKGDKVWDKTYGGPAQDEGFDLIETNDGGLAIGGYSYISHSQTEPNRNVWLIKTDANGSQIWDCTFGEKHWTEAHALVQNWDDSFIIGGHISPSWKENDAYPYLIKTDKQGVKIAEYKNTSGNGSIESIIITKAGNFAVCGTLNNRLWLASFEGDGLPKLTNTKDIAVNNPVNLQMNDTTTDINPSAKPNIPALPISTNNWEAGKQSEVISTESIDRTAKIPAKLVKNTTTPPEAEKKVLPITVDPTEHIDRTLSVNTIATSSKPNLHLIAVGTQPVDLQFTEKDAHDFADIFRDQGDYLGTGNKLFGRVYIQTLLGSQGQASTTQIRKAIETTKHQYNTKQIQSNDVLILFIASHGFIQDDKFRLQGHDYDPTAPLTTSIAYDDIISDLLQVDCKKLVFIDACHSGGARASVFAITDAIKEMSNTANGITTIVSSSPNEYAYEDASWENGAFTEAILHAFEGQADIDEDNIVSLYELFSFLQEEVPALVRGTKNQLQHPDMFQKGFGEIPLFVID